MNNDRAELFAAKNFVQTKDGSLYGTIMPSETAGQPADEGNVWVRPGGTAEIKQVPMTDLIPLGDAIDIFKPGDKVRITPQNGYYADKVYSIAMIPEAGQRVMLSIEGAKVPFHLINLARVSDKPKKTKKGSK